MESESKEMLTEIFKDKFDFSGKPEEVFLRYGLPIRKIQNVTEKTNGRSKSFVLRDKEYKRVELAAKAYYESLGYIASWSEGFAIDLLEAALTAEVVAKVSKYFKVADYYLDEKSMGYADVLKQQQELESSNPNSFYILSSAIRAIYDPSLRTANIIRMKESESTNSKFPEFIELLITEEEIKLKIQEAMNSVIEEKNIERIESSMQMHLEHTQHKYRNGVIPQNVNVWSLEFAKLVLNKVGFDRRFIAINNPRQFICRGFDLTVINGDGEIMFVEVKNKDKFTMYQNLSIGSYLEFPNDKIELCLFEFDTAA